MKRNFLKLSPLAYAITSVALLGGCTSTDVLPPDNNENKGHLISLSMSAPDAYVFTRADQAGHEGHQLRYVAKLFKKDFNGSEQFVARKEILAINGSATINFQGEEGDYTVKIFADYVNEGVSANEEGKYPDKYYNTSVKDATTGKDGEVISLRKEHSDKGDAINNDNYDCFAINHEFKKGTSIYEKSLTLKRAVSKIRIINREGIPSGVNDITIKKLSFLDEYNFSTGVGGAVVRVNNLSLDKTPVNLETNNELFYFYTFGGTPDNNDAYFKPDVIEFEINGKEGYEYKPVTIPGGTLNLIPNYIYNVAGSFLTPTTAPSNEIILTVTSNQDWANSGKDIPTN